MPTVLNTYILSVAWALLNQHWVYLVLVTGAVHMYMVYSQMTDLQHGSNNDTMSFIKLRRLQKILYFNSFLMLALYFFFFFKSTNWCSVKDIHTVLSALFLWKESVFDNREHALSAEFHFARALWGSDKMFNSFRNCNIVSEAFLNDWEKLFLTANMMII